MNKHEKRKISFNSIELRAEIGATGKKIVEGIIPYDSKSVPIWGTTEIISKTAFKKTLADKTVVRALYNHDDNRVLGSTESGTLVLENNEEGLICRCELPNTSYANDAYEVISRGDVKTMSFGFKPVKWIDEIDGKTRTLKEVKLMEVSFCVPFPAYEETTSLTYMRGLEKNNINIEVLNDALEKDELQDADKLTIQDTINSLRNLISEEQEAVETEQGNTTQEQVNTSVETKEDTTQIELLIEAELAI